MVTLQPNADCRQLFVWKQHCRGDILLFSATLRGEVESALSPPEREALTAEKPLRYFQINCTQQRTFQLLYQIEKTILS